MRIEDLLARQQAQTLGRVRVALPAQVTAYDPATQTVSAQIAVAFRRHDPDTDTLVPYTPPAVSNVPVLWPSCALGSLTLPLASGDWIFLLVADRSLDEWKATGAPVSVPMDVRRFDLTDCVALPGGRPLTAPLGADAVSPTGPVLAGDDVRLGDALASDFVALASLVVAELNAMREAFNLHTHPVAGAATGVPVTKIPRAGDVAATKVKAT